MSKDAMERDEALEQTRRIWELARRLKTSGHRDLEARAAQICSIAHHMLYDVSVGLEEQE